MNPVELHKRQNHANGLKVFQAHEGVFYVESSEGKVCYRVEWDNGYPICTCRDYLKNAARDQSFQCKHILAIQSTDGNTLTPLEMRKPRLDERFLSNIQGKDFVLYAGLLDLAHQRGLSKLYVEPLQYPSAENGQTAICKAIAESKFGEVFVDIGDANPNNTNRKIAIHILRMASTRAKARALRDMTNIGITCLEELGDLADAIEQLPIATKQPVKAVKATAATEPPAKPAQPPVLKEVPKEKPSSYDAMYVAQRKAIENLALRRGYTEKDLEAMIKEHYGIAFADLTTEHAAEFIRYLQKSA
jgi:hypothetical protein